MQSKFDKEWNKRQKRKADSRYKKEGIYTFNLSFQQDIYPISNTLDYQLKNFDSYLEIQIKK